MRAQPKKGKAKMDTTRKYRKVKNGKTTGYMKYVEHFEEWVVYNMRSEKAKHYRDFDKAYSALWKIKGDIEFS